MTGNHLADQADREREHRELCECGGQLKEVAWCEKYGDMCLKESCFRWKSGDCLDLKAILKCKRCGVRYEPE